MYLQVGGRKANTSLFLTFRHTLYFTRESEHNSTTRIARATWTSTSLSIWWWTTPPKCCTKAITTSAARLFPLCGRGAGKGPKRGRSTRSGMMRKRRCRRICGTCPGRSSSSGQWPFACPCHVVFRVPCCVLASLHSQLHALHCTARTKRLKLRSFYMMFVGTALILVFADPMVAVLSELGNRTGELSCVLI